MARLGNLCCMGVKVMVAVITACQPALYATS